MEPTDVRLASPEGSATMARPKSLFLMQFFELSQQNPLCLGQLEFKILLYPLLIKKFSLIEIRGYSY